MFISRHKRDITGFQRERNPDAAACPLTADNEMGCVFTLCVYAVIINHNRAFGGGCLSSVASALLCFDLFDLLAM